MPKNIKKYADTINITDDKYTFKDEFTKQTFYLNEKMFNKYLDHPYIKTCHCVQGTTIRDKYVIFDWKYFYVSVKWFYTAISRCSNINDIYFYDGDDNIKPLKYDISISSYKNQDKNRVYDNKDYIDYTWVGETLKKQKYQCALCHDLINGLSIDRVDNNIAHIKSNCQIACVQCNRIKG